jgi:hypothetical protein
VFSQRSFLVLLTSAAVAFVTACGGSSSPGVVPDPPHATGDPTPTPSQASTPTPLPGHTPTPTPHATPTPTPHATPTPVPTAPPGLVAHVKDYSFWNISGIATQVPASWIAAWADFAEIGDNAHAASFHGAGGKYAVAYTNPNYYYVSPSYTAPGNYAESAFGHGSGGGRSQRPQGTGTEYYLNPNSAASQSGFAGITVSIVAGGGFDYVYGDGVSDSLGTSLYRIAPTPVEITTDAQYVNGMKQLISMSSLPVIINGYNNGNPVKEEEYIGSSKVAAVLGESCFTDRTQVWTDQHWLDMANGLLYTTQRGYLAICGGRAEEADTRPSRIYWLASWWLTYDPNYSVALELMASDANPVYVFAEEQLVPTNPLQTASSISSLQTATGAYARQFGSCYYDKVAWGACAAIVNPSSTASTAMPSLASAYHHSLALDANDLYTGGQASLSSSVPATLGPGQAVVLFP